MFGRLLRTGTKLKRGQQFFSTNAQVPTTLQGVTLSSSYVIFPLTSSLVFLCGYVALNLAIWAKIKDMEAVAQSEAQILSRKIDLFARLAAERKIGQRGDQSQ